jgi:hypothetical protein
MLDMMVKALALTVLMSGLIASALSGDLLCSQLLDPADGSSWWIHAANGSSMLMDSYSWRIHAAN